MEIFIFPYARLLYHCVKLLRAIAIIFLLDDAWSKSQRVCSQCLSRVAGRHKKIGSEFENPFCLFNSNFHQISKNPCLINFQLIRLFELKTIPNGDTRPNMAGSWLSAEWPHRRMEERERSVICNNFQSADHLGFFGPFRWNYNRLGAMFSDEQKSAVGFFLLELFPSFFNPVISMDCVRSSAL